MPVVIDYNNVAWSVMVQDIKQNAGQNASLGIELNENFIRHVLINTIRSHVVKNRAYGDAIIACDGGSWRYRGFKQYKGRRKLAREQAAADQKAQIEQAEADGFDVVMIGNMVEIVREELKEYFPLKVIHVPGAEGDDVIATIAKQCRAKSQSCRIISSDKDFKQLHHDGMFFSTTQYSPTLKKEVTVDDPADFLMHLILGGDGGDDVPNVLQNDDHFLLPKDQQPKTLITAKMKKEWKQHWKGNRLQSSFFDEYNMELIWGPARARGITATQIRNNYRRNVMCVDLDMIPVDVVDDIEKALEQPFKGDVAKVIQYLAGRGLNRLAEQAGDFA